MTSSPKMTTTPPLTPGDDDILGCTGDLLDAVAAVLQAYPTPEGCLAPQQMLSGAESMGVMCDLRGLHDAMRAKWEARKPTKTLTSKEVVDYGKSLLAQHISCLAYKNTVWSDIVVKDVLADAKSLQTTLVDVDCTVWRSPLYESRHLVASPNHVFTQTNVDQALLNYALPGFAKYFGELHAPGFRPVLNEIMLLRDPKKNMVVMVTAKWVKSKSKRKQRSKPALKEKS